MLTRRLCNTLNQQRSLHVVSLIGSRRSTKLACRVVAEMPASHFKHAILGGGQSAGYAAREFVAQGLQAGELVIIGDEKVVAYERPALSKAYLAPDKPARLPGFHTCVGGGGERQDPEWYSSKGISYRTGVTVKAVELKEKKLSLSDDSIVTYDDLIIATGAKPISLAGKLPGAELQGVHYLRNVQDADQLVEAMQATKAKGGKAVMVGGGYIGMEVAAGVASNGIATTIIMPEDRLMSRLFTPQIAAYYERFYANKGITITKGGKCTAFEGAEGKVTHVVIEIEGKPSKLEADLVVVGIGARPNTELFQGQLDIENGGIKVDGRLQTSVPGVYAVGDVALFPLKTYGGGATVRQEHVIHARQSATHAVKAIKGSQEAYDYLPSFYSRVFSLSWVFYGINEGQAAHFGDFSEASTKFGAYWIKDGKVLGAFLEGGSADEAATMKKIAASTPAVPGSEADLIQLGLEFAAKL